MIIVTTNTLDFGGIDPPDNAVFVEYQSLTESINLQFPNYSDVLQQKKLPDFRNLLYWNPKVSISGSDTTISFYTGDRRGEYEVVIKGASKDDHLYFGKQTITVE